jgi:cell division inhibitor SepF
MANGSIWHRALVYFGLAEDESLYDDVSTVHEPAEERPSRMSSVRRLDRRRSKEPADEYDDLFADQETSPGRGRRGGGGSSAETSVLRPAAVSSAVRVHVIAPRSYNDAQQIADRFKNGVPVIVNLQTAEPDLSRRLIDFASGMTYALDGAIQRIAEKVFLLTPKNVEVSAEDRQRLVDQGFFNPGT